MGNHEFSAIDGSKTQLYQSPSPREKALDRMPSNGCPLLWGQLRAMGSAMNKTSDQCAIVDLLCMFSLPFCLPKLLRRIPWNSQSLAGN